MKIDYQPDFPISDEACQAATGKTLAEWFEVLDARGGPGQGRREIATFLYADTKDAWWSPTINVLYEAYHQLKEKDGRPKGYFICSTKTVAAPIETVYAAWATAEAMSPWFGPVTGAVSEGGQLKDDSGNCIIVKRVRENKDLRYQWVDARGEETLVDVQIADKGKGKTGVLVNHDRLQSRESADGFRRAWAKALDTLRTQLEAGR